LRQAIINLVESGPVILEAAEARNLRVLKNLLGPAFRGIIMQKARGENSTEVTVDGPAHFDWTYARDRPRLAKLYEAAKRDQWNATTDLPWQIDVDPMNPEVPLLPDEYVPLYDYPGYRKLDPKQKAEQRHGMMTWLLSQFLHGEQGALFAATQVTQNVPWMDAKLYGATQVVDEARHIEVFHRYLDEKLNKRYEINDSLYVIIDALMGDSRWDMKFLGMQIMIEGLALGAFGTLREASSEPLLREFLRRVISDEARHVQFGVIALADFYDQAQLSETERREREDWCFELSLLMRNRFLAHEFYDEYWGHAMSRKEWDRLVSGSRLMELFRRTMFRRIIPNIKRIGLLSDRIRPRYAKLGLLEFEHHKAAPELSLGELMQAAT
jgi:hypothetical protein